MYYLKVYLNIPTPTWTKFEVRCCGHGNCRRIFASENSGAWLPVRMELDPRGQHARTSIRNCKLWSHRRFHTGFSFWEKATNSLGHPSTTTTTTTTFVLLCFGFYFFYSNTTVNILPCGISWYHFPETQQPTFWKAISLRPEMSEKGPDFHT